MIPGGGAVVVAKKVAADQLTWTPVINTAFFFSTTLMATGDVGKSVTQVQDKLWPTLKVNWIVWPILQAVNMSMVPLQYRLLYINVCSLFWSAYLSNMASSKAPAVAADKSLS
jgi:protein Mpv17